MLGGGVGEPVLAFPAVAVVARLPRFGEPVGPFPARKLTEHGAFGLERLVQGRAADAAGGGLLPIREMVGVEQAEGFLRPLVEVAPVALERLHPGDVDIAEVEGFRPGVHPRRQRHPGAARRLDADRVEPGGNPDVVHLRRKAEVVGIVGGEALGAVEEGVNAGLGQHRHPVHRHLEDRLEMVDILGELVKLEIGGDPVHAPGLGHRLEGAEHHLAGVLLVIGAFVGHPQHRQRREPGVRLGDHVEMLAGVERHVGAEHPADRMAPHAGAVHHVVAGDCAGLAAALPGDAGDPPAGAGDPGDLHLFRHHRAALPGPLGEGLGDIPRIALPVQRQIDAADHAVDVEMGIFRLHLGGRDRRDLDPEGARHRGLAQDLFVAFRGERHGDRAHPLEASGDAGLGFERAVELLAVFREPRHVLGRAQLGDQPGGMPGGAGGEPLAFEQDDVGPSELGEVIGHRAADDAAADDDHPCLLRKLCHFRLSRFAQPRIRLLSRSHSGPGSCTTARQTWPKTSTSSTVPGTARSARTMACEIDAPTR